MEDEIYECSEGMAVPLPAFMKKPEVIKMHLEILFKSVPFLTLQKIEAMKDKYKKQKEQKRKEEEERLQMQQQMKKSRARNTATLTMK